MTDSSRHKKCQYRADKPWLDIQFHKGAKDQVVQPHELKDKLEKPPREVDEQMIDRIRGSIVGLALGDAVGAHVEFRPREYLLEHPVTDMQAGGTWGLAKGQFTDDTTMALCLACSLIARRGFVLYDQLVRYNWWKRYGYLSSTGHCFDIGRATKNALDTFSHQQYDFGHEHGIPMKDIDYLSDEKLLKEFPVNCSDEDAAGNGSLMRLAPVPLFFSRDPVLAVQYSGLSGAITHSDQKAIDSCRYYGALIVAALHGESRDELLDKEFYKKHKDWFGGAELHRDIIALSKGSYKKSGKHPKEIQGKGYVVQALEAALWAFWSDEGSFEKGVLLAVNLGDDTDTTAAIYGQLAGAFYGYKALPQKWVEKVYAREFLLCVSDWIAYEGHRWKPSENDPASPENSLINKADTKKRPESKSATNKDDDADAFENASDRSRRRRSTVHDLNSIGHKSYSSSQHNTSRARSKEPHPDKPRIYHHKDLKTSDDVYRRFVQKFGDQYREELKQFQIFDVDGYWLLNMIDEDNIERFGIKDPELKQKILNKINKLRAECPILHPSDN